MRRFLVILFLLLISFSAQAADKPNYKEVIIAAGASESSVFDISTITPGGGVSARPIHAFGMDDSEYYANGIANLCDALV